MITCNLSGTCPLGKNICCFFCEEEECKARCEIYRDREPATCESAVIEEDEPMVLFENSVARALSIIQQTELQKRKLDEQAKGMKEEIKEQMEKYGVKKFTNDDFDITYIAPTTRKTVDSRRLKMEKPDIWSDYIKESKVSSSVRIKVK